MTGNRLAHITLNELRSRLHDYTLLIITLVAPVIFATITSLAFAGYDHPQRERLVVTTGSADSSRNSLVRAIQADSVLQQVAVVDVVPSAAQARALIRDGSADAGLILSPQARLGPGRTPQLGGVADVLESQQQPLAAEVAQAVLQTIGGQVWLNHVVVTTLDGVVSDPPGTLRGFTPRNPVTLTDLAASSRTLTAATYYGSSMAIVFLLFVVTPMAKSLWTERQNNTLERLLASGVSRWTIVDWGDPAGIGLLITVTVAAAVALSFGIASVVRTEASMDGLVATVTFVLVLAGGNFIPPAALPGALRRLSLVTPNGWALRGFLDLATSNGGVSAIRASVLALIAFAAIIWLVIATRLRTLVSP